MKKDFPEVRPGGLRRLRNEWASPQGWAVTLLGGRELQAEGSGGIVRCDSETVAFQMGSVVFCVYGQDLSVDAMEQGGLIVRGRILRTELIP